MGDAEGEWYDAPGGRFWKVGRGFWYSEEDYLAGKPGLTPDIINGDPDYQPPHFTIV